MNTKAARDLGEYLADQVARGEINPAYNQLAPVLERRIPFPKLGLIGEAVGQGPLEPVNAFLDRIAEDKKEGGWVVIGTALGSQLHRDLPGALGRARDYIIAADIWYGADILGERVPGPALLSHFELTRDQLRTWREDENSWVRRTAGVAVHFWAKRTRAEQAHHRQQARDLLDFLAPLFWEWEMAVVKGVGWGLKTMGRYYPELLITWLKEDILPQERPSRALMLRKTLTYLGEKEQETIRQWKP